jgi:agmatine deiminase
MTGKPAKTPRELGYHMPAEWEPQVAVWLAWPHNRETWPGEALARVQRAYAAWIGALLPGQAVELLVGEAEVESARGRLAAAGVDPARVSLRRIATCDAWIRDYGPTFLVNRARGGLALVDWRFNAWGGKYAELLPDDRIPRRLNEELGMPRFEPGIVLEGGSIEVNGRGSLLTTEQCLLNPNRNPGLGRLELERVLGEQLGVRNVLWLGEGIAGDDTDGHVDDFARFVAPRAVVCAVEPDPQDVNHRPLREARERLARCRDERGRPLEVVELPMPGPVVLDGDRLPASYANFYIGNRCVAVPAFGHANDEIALAVLRKCFPGRRVVGIDCRAMVGGLGALHCGSQQQPAA